MPNETLTVPQLIQVLERELGDKLAWLVTGLSSEKEMKQIKRGREKADDEVESRLRYAHEVVTMLKPYDARDVIRAWFIGMNPILGDEAPASVIAAGKGEDALEAAKAFIAEG